MTEWSHAVWICVNLLICAFVMSIMAFFFQKGNTINNEISRQEANRSLMKEYREFNGFNDHVVYSQDAVSVILHYRGSVAVRVLHGTSEYAFWCTDDVLKDNLQNSTLLTNTSGQAVANWSCSAPTTAYTASAIQDKFDVDKVYKGSLTYGPNGEIMGITLVKGRLDSNDNFIAD